MLGGLGSKMGITGELELESAAPADLGGVELRGQLRIGGVAVRISGARLTDVIFDSEHEPFREGVGVSDIDLQVEWVADLAPIAGRVLFDSGSTWRLYRCEDEFQFDFIAAGRPYKRLFVDRDFHRARLQMNDGYFSAFPHLADPLGYPLDELLIMHRLTQEKGIELHSCGIVRPDGTGNLFVGHSGAGKSTTTRLWTAREDVEVLSDDRIIVRRDEGCDVRIPRKAAGDASKPEVLRLRDRSASPNGHSAQDDRTGKIPHFAQDDKKKSGMRMYGTPWHGEAAYASPGSAPLARIFILEHGRGNVLTRLSPSQAVGELFARSFVPFHRHEYVDSALEFLQELVGAVPVYHYAFEPNEAAVERILEFRD
jgi:hypothetical protein